jgi:hypothetical protein
MRYTTLFALLSGLWLSAVAEEKLPAWDIVRETLRASLTQDGMTVTSPDGLTLHGAWAFSTDGQTPTDEHNAIKRWNSMVEGSRLRLKAALVERGWKVIDGTSMTAATPTATVYDLTARQDDRTLRLYVSFFPGDKTAWIAYLQTETKDKPNSGSAVSTSSTRDSG